MGYANDSSIKLSDVLDISIHSPIVSDDHLTLASHKLLTICRAFRKKKIIKRISLINANDFNVKIVQLNDSGMKMRVAQQLS